MNNQSGSSEKTIVLSKKKKDRKKRRVANSPRLFVCCGTGIVAYDLVGTQVMGRPTGLSNPDIPIFDEYVSKDHGCFISGEVGARFIAEATTNGILYSGRFLLPGEEVNLSDGDELMIPTFSDNRQMYIHLIVAFSKSRIAFWEEMSHSTFDRLTDLPGRDTFTAWMINRKHYLKDDEDLIVGFMDVDDFKRINDVYGHLEGDNALKIVGECLKARMTEDTIACRWGGDEFVFAFASAGKRRGNRILQMKDKITEATVGLNMRITVSIGYTRIKKSNHERADEWINQADQALYQAKRKGKNVVCEYGINETAIEF